MTTASLTSIHIHKSTCTTAIVERASVVGLESLRWKLILGANVELTLDCMRSRWFLVQWSRLACSCAEGKEGNSMAESTGNERREATKDPAWRHCKQDPTKGKDYTQCDYCKCEFHGGITRLKQHIFGGYQNAKMCESAPPHVREEILNQMYEKKGTKVALNFCDVDMLDPLPIIEEEEDGEVQLVRRGLRAKGPLVSGAKRPRVKGPMDTFFTPDPEVVVQNRKGKQQSIKEAMMNDAAKKELRDRAVRHIFVWMYDAGIAFNAVNYDSFEPMIEAIGQYGPGMKKPSSYEVSVKVLKKEKERTNEILKDHQNEWVGYGCSLMADGWTDRKQRTLINFLVNCPKGSMFVDSVDASNYTKLGETLALLLLMYIEQVGPSNVVQVVTDSAAANVLAGKILEAKYPHLYWTPCAAHCVDLILEDIGKMRDIGKTIDRAICLSSFIYQIPGLLNMIRRYTQERDLIRPAKTRFATAFITLSSLHKHKSQLRQMFNSEEWNQIKWEKEQKGKSVKTIILMTSFWDSILFCLKVAGPLVHVLRIIDGEKKPPMGYIYEAMDRAMECIARTFNMDEVKYKDVFAIIKTRWEVQVHRPLHAAGHYLNPEFFYADPEVATNEEVNNGLLSCIRRLVPSEAMQDK